MLRSELAERANWYAIRKALPHALSYGVQPVVCFERLSDSLHGNFHPASYKAICRNRDWRARLGKAHTTARRCLPALENGSRGELDSCMSSDALLMNVFCHPGLLRDAAVLRLLGIEGASRPQFGWRARVPLTNALFDSTEVDMRIGNLLVEAKLTESDFQSAAERKVRRYRDFGEVFEDSGLPYADGQYLSYQLIRNVLAAYDRRSAFCVVLDERRPDLVEDWYAVMRCVKLVELRTSCKVLTWQELARVLPRTLRSFLAKKYGIG